MFVKIYHRLFYIFFLLLFFIILLCCLTISKSFFKEYFLNVALAKKGRINNQNKCFFFVRNEKSDFFSLFSYLHDRSQSIPLSLLRCYRYLFSFIPKQLHFKKYVIKSSSLILKEEKIPPKSLFINFFDSIYGQIFVFIPFTSVKFLC